MARGIAKRCDVKDDSFTQYKNTMNIDPLKLSSSSGVNFDAPAAPEIQAVLNVATG
jgi:hypothetical protein